MLFLNAVVSSLFVGRVLMFSTSLFFFYFGFILHGLLEAYLVCGMRMSTTSPDYATTILVEIDKR